MHICDRGFGTSQKRRADLNAACSKSKRGSNASAICDTPGGDHRDTHGIGDLRDERPLHAL